MTETVNLVLEHFGAVHADIAGLKDEMGGLRAAQTASRHDIPAVTTRMEPVLQDTASLEVRLDPIVSRLGLLDAVK